MKRLHVHVHVHVYVDDLAEPMRFYSTTAGTCCAALAPKLEAAPARCCSPRREAAE